MHPNLHERQICFKNLRKNSFSPFPPTWDVYNESVCRLLIVYLLIYVFIYVININYNVFLIIIFLTDRKGFITVVIIM